MAFSRFLSLATILFLSGYYSLSAAAQNKLSDEHIRITADKPAIISLNEEAASVVVGNPAHATAVLDNAHTLIINPLQPGATSLIVLNEKGQPILEKQLLINPPAKSYMRINRVCNAATGSNCQATSMYYCAEGCYEMILPEGAGDTASNQEDGQVEEPAEDGQGDNTVSEGGSE